MQQQKKGSHSAVSVATTTRKIQQRKGKGSLRKDLPSSHIISNPPTPVIHAQPLPPSHVSHPPTPVTHAQPLPPSHISHPPTPVTHAQPLPPSHVSRPPTPVTHVQPLPPSHVSHPPTPVTHAQMLPPSQDHCLPVTKPLTICSQATTLALSPPSSPTTENLETLWVQGVGFRLYQEDKQILSEKKWLNDRIINACQRMLENQSGGKIKGWQSTLYEQTPVKYKPIEDGVEFVQVLHIQKNHWITVSNIGCREGILNIYDSMYGTLNLQTKKQICAFWKPPLNQITFQMVNIQRQPNASDCGVFAIAGATELVYGKDPVLSYWDVTRMRSHLINCIEARTIECFPQARARRMPLGNQYKKVIQDTLFCICRMPNDRSVPMIQCDKCKLWFHKSCMNLNPEESLSGRHWCVKPYHHVWSNPHLYGQPHASIYSSHLLFLICS